MGAGGRGATPRGCPGPGNVFLGKERVSQMSEYLPGVLLQEVHKIHSL